MATCGLRLAALVLGLLGPPGATAAPPPEELPARARVTAGSLETYSEPGGQGQPLGPLEKGEEVVVVDADPASGWLTIAAPASAFAWIERSAVRPEGVGTARVSVPSTSVRAGVPGARMPGPPRLDLRRGSIVRLLDRPPIEIGSGRQSVTWLAIAAPPADVRHIRADGLAWVDPPRAAGRSGPEPPSEARTSFEEPQKGEPTLLPAEVASEVARIEAEHRAVLSLPVEQWRLDSVRARYEALGKSVTDPTASTAIQARLELVARQAELARSARAFQTILDRSRRRDQEIATARRNLATASQPQRSPYAARGLIQTSSRQVDGRRIFALIGPKGSPVAYLDIPPGLDTRRVLAKKVGVRGTVRYNETLGLQLIAVRDLDVLE